MKRISLLVFAMMVLMGCGSSRNQIGIDYLNKGDMLNAERYFTACLGEDPACSHNLAIVYWNRGEKQQAVNLWIYSAREGVPESKAALLSRGITPPPVDPYLRMSRDAAFFSVGNAVGHVGEAIGGMK